MDKLVNSKKKKQFYNTIYAKYTVLFAILSFIVFAVFIMENKTFIWSNDGVKQHYAILYHFNQMIRQLPTNGFQMLSWNLGLGLDVIGQYSYYVLGDPFAYFSLFFPLEYLEKVYSGLVIARMYGVGLAFIFYCQYHHKKEYNTLLGAIIYTFCGFVLYAGIRHPYFTNAVILLPLNLVGVDKLLKENKKAYFTFIIFITAVSNYYFFYMISIVNIIYATVRYLVEYHQGLHHFLKKVGSAVICYALGILMAGIILLPIIYAFIHSARTGCEQIRQYQPLFYQYFVTGIVCMRFKNWTAIAMASIVILMVPMLFLKRKEKESKLFFLLFLITTAMLLLPYMASMMNGFSFPSNRWAFTYAFILAYTVTLGFDTSYQYTKKQRTWMFVTLLIFTLLGLGVTRGNVIDNIDYYAAITIAFLMWSVISLASCHKLQETYATVIIFLLVGVNIWITSYALYGSQGKGYAKQFIKNGEIHHIYATANEKIEHYQEAIEYLKKQDTSFYRIAKKETNYQNLSIIYGYHPIELYLSLGNKNVFSLSESLDDRCYTTTRCVNGADRRTKMSTLLGCKYYICHKKEAQCVPYGYTLYHQIEETQIYKNQNYLPVGIVYDSYVSPEAWEKLSALEKEDALLSTAMIGDTVGADSPVRPMRKKDKEKIQTPLSLDYTIQTGNIQNNTIITKKQDKTITLAIDDIPENAELYVSFKNIQYKAKKEKSDFKVTAKMDGIETREDLKNCVTSAYYIDHKNFLMNLGNTNNIHSNKLTLRFDKKGTYTFDRLEVLAVSMKPYEQKVKDLTKMEHIQAKINAISGEVETKKAGILQIATSYSDGWKAYVDNKPVELLKVNQAFIGCRVEAGKHTVEFKYTTPYLKVGTICSVIGIIGYIGISIIEKRKPQTL